MEQVQRHFVKFDSSTLDIHSAGLHAMEEPGFTIKSVNWRMIEPFFVEYKNLTDYYPILEDGDVVGFRKKKLAHSRVVKNDDNETLKAIMPYENFIADCAIMIDLKDDKLKLTYDAKYFDALTNQENIDRLTLVKGKHYNLQVTQKGNPYFLYASYTIELDAFLEGRSIELEYSGPRDISVYAITKN
jgi:hypothetical protein